MNGHFTGTAAGIEEIDFANGTAWDRATILSKTTIVGTSGNDTYTGHADDEMIDGKDGNDTLDGGGGNDTLTGGNGDDIFVFHAGAGREKITDFTGGAGSGDVIKLLGFAINTYSEVLAAATQVGNDLVIAVDNGTSITLLNRTSADLHQHDFVFA